MKDTITLQYCCFLLRIKFWKGYHVYIFEIRPICMLVFVLDDHCNITPNSTDCNEIIKGRWRLWPIGIIHRSKWLFGLSFREFEFISVWKPLYRKFFQLTYSAPVFLPRHLSRVFLHENQLGVAILFILIFCRCDVFILYQLG